MLVILGLKLKTFLYKSFRSIVPCLLLTLSIGFCYSFSLFAPHIADKLEVTRTSVNFAFCLNIFFLGIGAAFFGNLVEKHIKIASVTASILLFTGLMLTGYAVNIESMALVYVGIGILCGLAEGCGYVVPVKNLLLWWSKTNKKGLVSSISIISFGLGSTLCSYLFKLLFPSYGIDGIFYVLGIIYAVPTIIATALINKPKYALIKLKNGSLLKFKELLGDGFFRKSWLFMFLNISMGLILIGSCASILKEINLSNNAVIIVMMLCGIFNGCGRLVFPIISDFLTRRINIWLLILFVELCIMLIPTVLYAVMPISIILINATYGSAFATLPSVLSDHYGNNNLSQIHGFVLSAWGFASLLAYFCTSVITTIFNGYYFITFILLAVYAINLLNVFYLRKETYNNAN